MESVGVSRILPPDIEVNCFLFIGYLKEVRFMQFLKELMDDGLSFCSLFCLVMARFSYLLYGSLGFHF